MRWALTETTPVIKAYSHNEWANLPDCLRGAVEPSLVYLEGIHGRIVMLAEMLDTDDYTRAFIHPEKDKPVTLAATLQLYSWHGKHHLAHIEGLKEREGWS
jgi:hypothetical protein